MPAAINMWKSVRKPSITLLIIDTSSSMGSVSGTGTATGISSVRNAAQKFIAGKLPQDFLLIEQFSSSANFLQPSGLTNATSNITNYALNETWRQDAIKQVGNLVADGGTRFYDSISEGVKLIDSYRVSDQSANIQRNYGIILMTDGQDTSSSKFSSISSLLSTIPDGKESDQVHIFTIGFGSDVNENELQALANRTNGKYYY
ncbi:hypothetical protein HK096_002096, partial [Nowakowskiella sp. JEL0078]